MVAETEKKIDGMALSNLEAMVVFPEPLGAARMMIQGPPKSFDILDLFANFFQFFLHSNHQMGHFRII